MPQQQTSVNSSRSDLQIALCCVIVSVYIFYFLNWLFYWDNPSILSALTLVESLRVLTITPLPAMVVLCVATLIFHCLAHVLKLQRTASRFQFLYYLIPAAIQTCTCLLLLDSIFHASLHSEMGSGGDWARLLWLFGFVCMFFLFLRIVRAVFQDCDLIHNARLALITCLSLPIASIIWAIGLYFSTNEVTPQVPQLPKTQGTLPNILIIGSDGMSASHLSLYGYERNTTPNLRDFALKNIWAENAFSNGCSTTNAVPSLLSGRLPTDSGIVFTPDYLRGVKSFEHFPAILKRLGYQNYDFGVPVAADVNWLNFNDGFDQANLRSAKSLFYQQAVNIRILFSAEWYFQYRIAEKLGERLAYLFLHLPIIKPEVLLVGANTDQLDQAQIAQLLQLIKSEKKPFFAHIHLMGTHGPFFDPQERVFSQEKSPPQEWDLNRYDDAIREFDDRFHQIMEQLHRSGKAENTIIVVYSDHGMAWSCEKTPLVMSFPNRKEPMRVQANVQQLDVAATILDYLEIPLPSWVKGQSILENKINPMRPIFFAAAVSEHETAPPHRNLTEWGAYICQFKFILNLNSDLMTRSEIQGHTSLCPIESFTSDQQILQMLHQHLRDYGYIDK